MKKNLSRREFLKISSLLSLLSFIPGEFRNNHNKTNNSSIENVLVIVFDAWSAHNISLYGYPRDTTPNLKRLADRGIVYHNHYSSASWTLPGTASLLTGVYPWTHRAINSRSKFNNQSGLIEKFQSSNIFSLFQDEGFSTLAYTHNPYTEILLRQQNANIDFHIKPEELYLNDDPLFGSIFPHDDLATRLADRQIFWDKDAVANSLLLSPFLNELANNELQNIVEKYANEFPRKPPSLDAVNYYYLQEDATDWLLKTSESQTNPFLGYVHFYPPHGPYRTRREFINIFRDEWDPPSKPEHIFSEGISERRLSNQRRYYDEFISYVDAEFARMFSAMEENGLLNNTWIVLTSDHGESFERSSLGHSHLLLHNPVIHIPLIIFPPDQKERRDIYHRTNAIDILPTLLNVMNSDIPSWCEGRILPPFQINLNDNERSIFSLRPRDTLPHSKLTEGVYSIFKGDYKLIYSFGLKEMKEMGFDSYFELYNIVNDPEELNNLYDYKKNIAEELHNELISEMKRADEPYA